MVVESDPGFKHRYGCTVAPAMVDVAGQTTTKVRVFTTYTEPVSIHVGVVMASMDDDNPLDQYNYQSTR